MPASERNAVEANPTENSAGQGAETDRTRKPESINTVNVQAPQNAGEDHARRETSHGEEGGEGEGRRRRQLGMPTGAEAKY